MAPRLQEGHQGAEQWHDQQDRRDDANVVVSVVDGQRGRRRDSDADRLGDPVVRVRHGEELPHADEGGREGEEIERPRRGDEDESQDDGDADARGRKANRQVRRRSRRHRQGQMAMRVMGATPPRLER